MPAPAGTRSPHLRSRAARARPRETSERGRDRSAGVAGAPEPRCCRLPRHDVKRRPLRRRESTPRSPSRRTHDFRAETLRDSEAVPARTGMLLAHGRHYERHRSDRERGSETALGTAARRRAPASPSQPVPLPRAGRRRGISGHPRPVRPQRVGGGSPYSQLVDAPSSCGWECWQVVDDVARRAGPRLQVRAALAVQAEPEPPSDPVIARA